MIPRGIRQKNPGNIRFSHSQKWQGLDNPPEEGGFCVFKEPVFGLRAMMKILRNYQRVHDLNTIRQVVTRWAPHEDNNPVDNYVKYVARRTFLDPDDPLDWSKKAFVIPVVRAMCEFEQGPKLVSYEEEVYQRAADMAGIT